VNDGVLAPQNTVEAGWSGQNLALEFFPANDGTADSIAAVISNQHALAFENTLIKFRLPAEANDFTVTNGEILQMDTSADPYVIYVSTDLPANSVTTVTITTESVDSEDEVVPDVALNLYNYPNPFNPETVISFSLTAEDAKNAKLEIYNIKGQRIKDLSPSLFHTEPVEVRGESKFKIAWDGTDSNSKPVPSGIYLYKLSAGKHTLTKKMLLVK
jgi:hypothetical protein